MALIRCNHCGKMVSDRASKCPHCGCNPLEENKKPQNVVEETTIADTSNVSDGNTDERSSIKSKTLVVTMIVLVIVALGAGAFLWLHHGKSQVAENVVPDSLATDSTTIDTCAADTAIVEEKPELKYSNIPDRLRMNLIGKVKKIDLHIDDRRQDPMENGHGLYDWTYVFDSQGMLKTCSTEHEMYVCYDITTYYSEGKLVKTSGEHYGDNETYEYEYRQTDEHTVNVMQISSSGEEKLALILTFYDNGNLKEKRILTSLIEPYTDYNEGEFVVKYNSDGVEIDNKSHWGHLTQEMKDSKGNWIERTYECGLTLSRTIEYF